MDRSDRQPERAPMVRPQLAKVEASLQETRRVLALTPDPATLSLLRAVEGLFAVVRQLAERAWPF
jgi:hypothetical protein